MLRNGSLLVVAVIFLGADAIWPSAATAQVHKSTFETNQLAEDFRWFDSLGYPHFGGHQLIQTIPWWIQAEAEPNSSWPDYAFLLDDGTTQYRTFSLDLREEVLARPLAQNGDKVKASYINVDLIAVANSLLAELQMPVDEWREIDRYFSHRVSDRLLLFVLARACEARGHHQLTQALITCAASMPNGRTGEKVGLPGLRRSIAEDIAYVETWRTFEAIGDPQISREEILSHFRWIAQRFPDSQYTTRVDEAIQLLTQMVEEDRAHAAAAHVPLEQMTVKQRVAELIFQLRDQNSCQLSQPGSCDIFYDPRDVRFGEPNHKPKSAAAQLVAIGRPALEQLIDSVDDQRFTRCVEYHRNFRFSHRIIRVGECCHAIMNKIAPTGRVWNQEPDRERAKREMKTWYLGPAGKTTSVFVFPSRLRLLLVLVLVLVLVNPVIPFPRMERRPIVALEHEHRWR